MHAQDHLHLHNSWFVKMAQQSIVILVSCSGGPGVGWWSQSNPLRAGRKLVQGFKEKCDVIRATRKVNDYGSRMLSRGEGAELQQ